jgi:lysophospholipase L1-like esterase
MKRRKLFKLITGMTLLGIINNDCAEDDVEDLKIIQPNNILDLKRWYDFTDLSTITKDGGNLISQLNDKGPDADHATAALGARPLYVANVLNGNSVGRFDGVANVLSNTEVNYGTTFTIFVVSSVKGGMNTIAGTAVDRCIMTNSFTFDLRTDTPDRIHYCDTFQNESLYNYPAYGDEYYSVHTIRATAGVLKHWERKNVRGYSEVADGNIGTLILKGIGGFAGYFFNKDIIEIATYTRALSDNEVIGLNDYFEKKYKLYSLTLRNLNRITFVGNSFTAMPYYRYHVMNNLGSTNWFQSRYGHGGAATAAIFANSECKALLKQRLNAPVTGYDIVVVWEGTNDLFAGSTPAQAEANLAILCGAFQAQGFQVIVCTVLPRVPAGSFTEAERLATNVLLNANYLTYADAIADVAADALMGNEHDNEDLTYYTADQIHPNDAGMLRLVTEWIQPAIAGLL